MLAVTVAVHKETPTQWSVSGVKDEGQGVEGY
jgi:hypothetical protein